MSEALQSALFPVPKCLCGAKKRNRNGLEVFGVIAAVTRTILFVYRQNNLGHPPPQFIVGKRTSNHPKGKHVLPSATTNPVTRGQVFVILIICVTPELPVPMVR
jgi:hypothetical protein